MCFSAIQRLVVTFFARERTPPAYRVETNDDDDENQEIQRGSYRESSSSRDIRAREITPNWEKNMDFRITLLLIIGKYFIEAFITTIDAPLLWQMGALP